MTRVTKKRRIGTRLFSFSFVRDPVPPVADRQRNLAAESEDGAGS